MSPLFLIDTKQLASCFSTMLSGFSLVLQRRLLSFISHFFPTKRVCSPIVLTEKLWHSTRGSWRNTTGRARPLLDYFLNMQHRLNPLHICCRLIERGFSKKLSLSICKYYEILIYSWLVCLTMVPVRICKFANPTSWRPHQRRSNPSI